MARTVRLDFPRPDGTTIREHLVALVRITGEPEPDLEPPHPYVDHLVGMFFDCAAGRQSFWDAQPIPWREIEAWSRLRNLTLCPFEIDVIRAADSAFRNECAAILAERRPPERDEDD